jgi:hypothetical protein
MHFAPGTIAECQTERGDEFPERQRRAVKKLSFETDRQYQNGSLLGMSHP